MAVAPITATPRPTVTPVPVSGRRRRHTTVLFIRPPTAHIAEELGTRRGGERGLFPWGRPGVRYLTRRCSRRRSAARLIAISLGGRRASSAVFPTPGYECARRCSQLSDSAVRAATRSQGFCAAGGSLQITRLLASQPTASADPQLRRGQPAALAVRSATPMPGVHGIRSRGHDGLLTRRCSRRRSAARLIGIR